MRHKLCRKFHLNDARIATCLGMVGLVGPEFRETGRQLQRVVIRPHVDRLIDDFYAYLMDIGEFRRVVRRHATLPGLKETQRDYLLSLGVDFDRPAYVEDRLRIGSVHQQAGVSLGLYQCAYRKSQSLLIGQLLRTTGSDPVACEMLLQFILKITAYDMSLAIETYYADKVVRMQNSIVSMRQEGRELRKMAETDSLTGLCSRRQSLVILREQLRQARADTKPLSVVMVDIDHFKSINDSFGHPVGDKVLRAIGSRLLAGARDLDTVGRVGGEEFLLIVRNADIAGSMHVARRIRRLISDDPFHLHNATLYLTVSLGIAQALESDDADSLIARADAALYEAKAAGRNCISVAESQHHQQPRVAR